MGGFKAKRRKLKVITKVDLKPKKRPVRLGVRTLDFHSRNRGSIPLRATKPSAKVGGFFYPVNFNYFGYAGSVDAPNLVQLSGRRVAGRGIMIYII